MKKILSNYKFLLLATLSLLLSLWGCSSKSISEDNPEDLYHAAEEEISDKQYLQAIERLRAIKNRFPYSKYSTMAALRMADVYYLEESFPEAVAAYEAFRDLHPKYEKADYVLFRIGESYFQMIPSTFDRDLTPATKAIDSFTELKKLYPSSSLAHEANAKIIEATTQLAQKELYIADYYYKKGMYESAATRYEKITKNFAEIALTEKAYIKLSHALRKSGKADESKHILKVYLERYPHGDYVKSASEEIDD